MLPPQPCVSGSSSALPAAYASGLVPKSCAGWCRALAVLQLTPRVEVETLCVSAACWALCAAHPHVIANNSPCVHWAGGLILTIIFALALNLSLGCTATQTIGVVQASASFSQTMVTVPATGQISTTVIITKPTGYAGACAAATLLFVNLQIYAMAA